MTRPLDPPPTPPAPVGRLEHAAQTVAKLSLVVGVLCLIAAALTSLAAGFGWIGWGVPQAAVLCGAGFGLGSFVVAVVFVTIREVGRRGQ